MTSKADFDVIVVGAGPVGAAASLLLADYGLEVLVIDKEAQIYPLPRAAHIDHEIVRVLQSVGAADDVMALPPLASGCLLEGSKWAGIYFPQPWNATDKLDDVLEKSAWLISHKKGAKRFWSGPTVMSLVQVL